MTQQLKFNKAAALRGFVPSIVSSNRAAFEQSERNFSKLDAFSFTNSATHALISSGARFRGWTALLVGSSGHSITLSDEERLTLLFPYAGSIEVEQGRRVARAEAFEVLVVGAGKRTTNVSQDYVGGIVQVPAAAIQHLDDRSQSKFANVLATGAPWRVTVTEPVAQAHRIMQQLEGEASTPATSDAWLDLISPLWESLAASNDDFETEAAAASLRQVRHAEAFIDAQIENPLTLEAIARAIGVGGRSLQVAFQRHRRCSPLQFLRQRRLQMARQRLSEPSECLSVTTIAIECGFTHLGRFAQQYREAFGEAPHETARAAEQRWLGRRQKS